MASAAKPDTILGWYRKLIARKFDGSKARRYPGRPRVDRTLEELVVRMAKENIGWGYDRIVGALANLGYTLSDETVGNLLRRNGISPAPERKQTTTWKDFIRAHMAVLAGTDFFTVEVLMLRGLVTYYVLRRVTATRVALIALLTPVLALLLGSALNAEPVQPVVWSGAAGILCGLVLFEYGEWFGRKLVGLAQ